MSGAVATGTTARVALRRNRALLGLVALVLVVVGLLAWAGGQQAGGSLDPASVHPTGSRALAALLEDQGVRVVRVERATDAVDALREADGATLLVTRPALVTDTMAAALAGATVGHVGHVVLLGVPDVGGPWPTLTRTDSIPVRERDPGCALDIAVRAGSASTGGVVVDGPVRCYDGGLVELPATDGRSATTVLGAPDPLTNAGLADLGNAALATGLLGRDPTLVWWLPSYADPLAFPGGERQDLAGLVPPWVFWVFVQLGILALVLAVVRGRRFGRVVTEPLPVTVRASETTEGVARLYRRSGDRRHAAAALAQAARTRLADTLGLTRGSDPAVLVARVAAATGRDPAAVRRLLTEPDPADDAALARYPTELADLERQVRHP